MSCRTPAAWPGPARGSPPPKLKRENGRSSKESPRLSPILPGGASWGIRGRLGGVLGLGMGSCAVPRRPGSRGRRSRVGSGARPGARGLLRRLPHPPIRRPGLPGRHGTRSVMRSVRRFYGVGVSDTLGRRSGICRTVSAGCLTPTEDASCRLCGMGCLTPWEEGRRFVALSLRSVWHLRERAGYLAPEEERGPTRAGGQTVRPRRPQRRWPELAPVSPRCQTPLRDSQGQPTMPPGCLTSPLPPQWWRHRQPVRPGRGSGRVGRRGSPRSGPRAPGGAPEPDGLRPEPRPGRAGVSRTQTHHPATTPSPRATATAASGRAGRFTTLTIT